MTPLQWQQICERVTDEMLDFTRPFVTPLGTQSETNIWLVGTGSYVTLGEQRILLTCEHVACQQPIHYRFFGDDTVFEHQGPWRMDRHPIDAAQAPISYPAWDAVVHQAQAVPTAKFARTHSISEAEELLFFRGFAGENAHYAFGIHQTNGTGYCSQEVKDSGDAQIFEMFWDPQKTRFTTSATSDARAEIKFENAEGLSGSLVWNTRFLETRTAGKQWTPDDAVVTGLLRRWDPATKTLLVWRVEHLLAWLGSPQKTENIAR
jgi:hypothetical protein